MILISIVLAILLLIFIFSSVMVNVSDYKYYKKVYKTLPSITFKININQVYGFTNDNSHFIWFTKTNDFCLIHRHYLYNSIFTYFDPYSLYWLIKYHRWFKKNIDIYKLEKY